MQIDIYTIHIFMGRNSPCILTSESRSHTYISYYVVATPRNGGFKSIHGQLKFDVVRLASETSVYQELDSECRAITLYIHNTIRWVQILV